MSKEWDFKDKNSLSQKIITKMAGITAVIFCLQL